MHVLRPCIVPDALATSKLEGLEKSEALCFIREHRHFPVNLLNASPTAMGLMSGGQPGLYLFKAVRQPPARNVETEVGTLPEERMLLREKHMEVGNGMLAAS